MIGVVFPIAGLRSKNHRPKNINQNKFLNKHHVPGTANLNYFTPMRVVSRVRGSKVITGISKLTGWPILDLCFKSIKLKKSNRVLKSMISVAAQSEDL